MLHHSFRLTGEKRRVLNLGSYNYLGFGDPNSATKSDVFGAIQKFSVSTGSVRSALGIGLPAAPIVVDRIV